MKKITTVLLAFILILSPSASLLAHNHGHNHQTLPYLHVHDAYCEHDHYFLHSYLSLEEIFLDEYYIEVVWRYPSLVPEISIFGPNGLLSICDPLLPLEISEMAMYLYLNAQPPEEFLNGNHLGRMICCGVRRQRNINRLVRIFNHTVHFMLVCTVRVYQPVIESWFDCRPNQVSIANIGSQFQRHNLNHF